MTKPKTVQMPEAFLLDVYKLVALLDGYDLPKGIQNLTRTIETQIQGKIEAMERRNMFTAYKTATIGSTERENSRQKYLDSQGMGSKWRSQTETLT